MIAQLPMTHFRMSENLVADSEAVGHCLTPPKHKSPPDSSRFHQIHVNVKGAHRDLIPKLSALLVKKKQGCQVAK